MPAVSDKQRKAIAIAEYQPGKLFKRNRGLLKMKRSAMHDFVATKGLKKKSASLSSLLTSR